MRVGGVLQGRLNDRLLQSWCKQGATVESIEQKFLTDTLIPMPPINDQEKIVNYLKLALNKIDYLIKKTEISIDLLIEHRSALITAAVTGKIDVREQK
jgi:type I restriction enzyme S subunit